MYVSVAGAARLLSSFANLTTVESCGSGTGVGVGVLAFVAGAASFERLYVVVKHREWVRSDWGFNAATRKRGV